MRVGEVPATNVVESGNNVGLGLLVAGWVKGLGVRGDGVGVGLDGIAGAGLFSERMELSERYSPTVLMYGFIIGWIYWDKSDNLLGCWHPSLVESGRKHVHVVWEPSEELGVLKP